MPTYVLAFGVGGIIKGGAGAGGGGTKAAPLAHTPLLTLACESRHRALSPHAPACHAAHPLAIAALHSSVRGVDTGRLPGLSILGG